MIFFDGEEGPKSLGAGDPNWMALGSPYFVAHLGDFYSGRKPEKGVVFDMVCYRTLQLHPELVSLYYARAETAKFWSIGASLAPSVFLSDPTASPVSDDQTSLDRAGIPSLLVIDFQYEPWFNTSEDTLDKCSAAKPRGGRQDAAALSLRALSGVYFGSRCHSHRPSVSESCRCRTLSDWSCRRNTRRAAAVPA